MNKQKKLFCYYYHCLRNVQKALICAGYSKEQLQQSAQDVLQNQEVQQEIQRLDEQRAQRELKEIVISGLIRLATGENQDAIRLLLGQPEELQNQLETLDFFAISELKRSKNDVLEIKFFDRYQALLKLYELAEQEQGSHQLKQFYQTLEQDIKTTQNTKE